MELDTRRSNSAPELEVVNAWSVERRRGGLDLVVRREVRREWWREASVAGLRCCWGGAFANDVE